MLEQSTFAWSDQAQLRAFLDANPWGILASGTAGSSPVVSHLPLITQPGEDDLVALGHVARKDAELHELGDHDVVVIVEGPHGYISPSWYGDGPFVPTWNFQVLHLHGRPEMLDADETYAVLSATVDHLESKRPSPWRLDSVDDYARSIAPYTTGFRLTPTRVVGKSKLSQDKSPAVAERVIAALESDDPYSNPSLATAMREHWGLS